MVWVYAAICYVVLTALLVFFHFRLLCLFFFVCLLHTRRIGLSFKRQIHKTNERFVNNQNALLFDESGIQRVCVCVSHARPKWKNVRFTLSTGIYTPILIRMAKAIAHHSKQNVAQSLLVVRDECLSIEHVETFDLGTKDACVTVVLCYSTHKQKL